MYKIIGADGREYGPVTAEQVRNWVTQGRANGDTKVLAEGATEWKRLGALPEFAALFAEPEPEPAAAHPPVAYTGGSAEVLAEEIIRRDFDIDIGSCFSRGWELMKSKFWPTVGAAAIVTILSSALGYVPAVGTVAVLLINYVLWAGLYWFFLRIIRGRPAEVGDVFAGFSLAFLPLMLYSLVGQLLAGIGLLFCILPGIYLFVAWNYAGLLILDKKLEFWPAMELSRRVVTHRFWEFLGLTVVSLALILLGVLACGIGVFIAIPLVCAATVYAYEDAFGSAAIGPKPSTGLMPVTPAPTSPAPAEPNAPSTPAPATGPTTTTPAAAGPTPTPVTAPSPAVTPPAAQPTTAPAAPVEPPDPGPQI